MDPKAEPPGTALNVNFPGGSDDDAASGLMYAALLAAAADEAPELAPVCGGDFIPAYETELSIYRSLVTINDEAATKSGKQLAQVVGGVTRCFGAGFLDEFVWVELHRESWGTAPPPELTLPEYQAWRKKNLKRFKAPNFGGVIVQHPRPLPPEPATP